MSANADFVFCALWVFYPRCSKIDFSHSFIETCITFLVPRPQILPYNWISIFQQLSGKVWGAILISFVIIIIASKLFYFLTNSIHNQNINEPDYLITIIGLFVTGNSIPITKVLGLRSLLSAWGLVGLFICMFYSSDLVSYLTLNKYTKRIDTPDDFVKSNLTWGIFEYSGFTFLNLETKSDRIIKTRVRYETYNNTDRVINDINQNRFAVLAVVYSKKDVVIFRGIDNIPLLKLRLMKHCFYKPFISYGFPKNSPYRLMINKILYRIFETGLYQKIRKNVIKQHYKMIWDSLLIELDSIPGTSFEQLKIEHMLGAFVVLGIGIGISCVVFIFENFGERMVNIGKKLKVFKWK